MKKFFNWRKVSFTWFQLFKYGVFCCLITNVLLFFNKEATSFVFRFTDSIVYSDIIDAFSSTIDNGAWVVLILVFELKTFILSEEQLKGNIKWILRILSSFSYLIIGYAFYGYIIKYYWINEFSPMEATSLCTFIDYSWMLQTDQFKVINPENCTSLSDSLIYFRRMDTNILTDLDNWRMAVRLVLVDIFNAAAWIGVVIILEIDIWLQLKNQLKGGVYLISKIFKGVLYFILLLAALYWGFSGNFLEFWDAFLWIIAFIFIENNLFEWQAKTIDA